jgi:hypothetical protein
MRLLIIPIAISQAAAFSKRMDRLLSKSFGPNGVAANIVQIIASLITSAPHQGLRLSWEAASARRALVKDTILRGRRRMAVTASLFISLVSRGRALGAATRSARAVSWWRIVSECFP